MIEQDVARTRSDETLFSNKLVSKKLIRILFSKFEFFLVEKKNI